MRINILSLFPNSFSSFFQNSIPAIAIEKQKLTVNLIDIRDFADNKHRQVDDYPYGGGAGMVLKPEPLALAIESVTLFETVPIIYFTPQGKPLTQSIVREFLEVPEVILVCGHYKEIDQRIRDKYITHEISIGDYVLSGGELPAMAFTDAIARLLDGVISDSESATTDSFENGLLGYPCYTRPPEFMGMSVPEVLTNGNHALIEKWHSERSIENTLRVRPEIFARARKDFKTSVYIGLVHHPVVNKMGETITSGITNLDVHDISRSAISYDVKFFFLIHPNERQREIFEQILGFWKTEVAAYFNPDRVSALSVINFTKNISDTIRMIKKQERNDPVVITTTAKNRDDQSSFLEIKNLIHHTNRPVLILFGTANGLHETVHDDADSILVPIQATSGYNHLSVRSAVAIVLDRLLSDEYKE